MNAMISLKGTQFLEDGNQEDIEFMTEGTLYRQDNATFIAYQETELTGALGINTVVKIDAGTVMITRSEQVNSEMIFEKGRRHLSYYDTPLGGFTVEVYTTELKQKISENRVNLNMTYEMVFNNTSQGKNVLELEAKVVH